MKDLRIALQNSKRAKNNKRPIERMFEDSGLDDRNYKRLIRNQCRRIWRKWIDK